MSPNVMKLRDEFDQTRRAFLQTTSQAIAAGLLLPHSLSALADAAALEEANLAPLKKVVKGSVVSRSMAAYESWRLSMIWNLRKFDRYPDVIVQAEDEQDVIETILFAGRHGLKVKTRTGGHCWSGSYLRNEGILLDLSRFQSVEIDTGSRIAKVGPGVLSRNLAFRLGQVGLAFPIAHSGMVPLSGFLLGGGLGWNANFWGGMSVFNIEALDVVTADGEPKHVDADTHPELFWAARGAGPGLFFTVTRFYLRCHPLPGAITTDSYIFPESELVASVELMEELGPNIDRAVELLSVVVPREENCSPKTCERIVVLNAKAFADTPAAAKHMLGPLRKHPLLQKALQKEVGRVADFERLFQEEEVGFPQRRGRADNIITDRAVEAAPLLSKHMPLAPSLANTPLILYLGENEFPDAAYSAAGKFYMSAYAQWDDAADDAANASWMRSFYDDMQPFARSHYINEFDREARSAQIPKCFAAENWQRIRELKQERDPENVFHDFIGMDAA